jgi:hypothetical protein
MPGFNIVTGKAGQTGNRIETRRKHRWKFTSLFGGSPFLLLLKSASRPSFTLEEPVMHHNQEQVYFAGKQSWETIELVWYDAEQEPNVSKTVWDWLNTVVDVSLADVSTPSEYKVNAKLEMLQGDGSSNEKWDVYGAWPKDVKWNELDYESTDIQQVTVTLRYDRAVRAE